MPRGVSNVDSDETVIPEGSSKESSEISSSSSVLFLLEYLSNVLLEDEEFVLAFSDVVPVPVLAGDEDEEEQEIDVEPGLSM